MVRRGLLSRADLDRRARDREHARPSPRPGAEGAGPRRHARARAGAGTPHPRDAARRPSPGTKRRCSSRTRSCPTRPPEDLTLRCSTAELILELVRRIPGPETVQRGLGSLDRPLVAVDTRRSGWTASRSAPRTATSCRESTDARGAPLIQTASLPASGGAQPPGPAFDRGRPLPARGPEGAPGTWQRAGGGAASRHALRQRPSAPPPAGGRLRCPTLGARARLV